MNKIAQIEPSYDDLAFEPKDINKLPCKSKLVGRYKKGGIFRINLPTGRIANVIVSGEYRGHASVSTGLLFPTWQEMEYVKQQVFGDNEVYQIHPKKSSYVNIAEVLHLWGDVNDEG